MRSHDLFFVKHVYIYIYIYIYTYFYFGVYMSQMEIVFLCFDVLYFLCAITRLECFHADVEAARPGGASPLDR